MTDDTTSWQSKGAIIGGVCLTFFIALIGYIFSKKFDVNSLAATFLSIYLGIIFYLLKPCFSPLEIKTIGSTPSNLIQPQLFENIDKYVTLKGKEKRETPLRYMLWKTIRELEEKIWTAADTNKKRSDAVGSAVSLLYWTPLIPITVYLLTALFAPYRLSFLAD
jgi:hypothetical protein